LVEQTFKYRRDDFGELPVKLNHLTIYLNFLPEMVEATELLDITAKQRLDKIELDARDLKILSVEWIEATNGTGQPAEYDYLEKSAKLVVKLPKPVNPGDTFHIRTATQCFPSDNILEGIYKDTTPPGAPQQYMSQCQQWGFQRIMPIFDDCRAKCTMTTTLEGDAAYTHLISNGNISRTRNPDGKPVPKPGDPSRQIITYENNIPMAPYLFIAAAGTWDVLVDEAQYESGKKVGLEYLVPPGRSADVRLPMDILKQAVLWIQKTQDYEYTRDTYRTICMNKSNFGGMENTGNTTIVTDAALIDEHTMDQFIIYAHAVIVHEFEHNQCGSETTMETPFDVWLNEAYTVDVERQFMADVFDPAFMRLNQVDSIRNPLLGPLAIEDSGRAGNIVRDAFNDPDELIDGVTYVKAAEVIRMLRLVIGPAYFRAGKTLYFSRYKDSNANTDQFFECFEEVCGRSLEQFKKTWLYTLGYPKVTAVTNYDATTRQYHIDIEQEPPAGAGPFHIPIQLALVDENGRTVPGTDKTLELTRERQRLTLSNITHAPAFSSLNRGYSFYGTLRQPNADTETLAVQARLDTDPFNRVEAMRQLTDVQRVALLQDPDHEIDPNWIELYGTILRDTDMSASLKAFFIRIEEQPLDRRYLTWYREQVTAREKLMLAVNRAYKGLLLELFQNLDTYSPGTSPKDGIEERVLKHVLLDLIAVDDSPESHRLILEHFRNATTAQDRVSALTALNRCSATERREVLEEVYRAWHTHLSGYANYLRVVAAGTCDDVFDMIEAEKRRPTFDPNQPTWSRAIHLPMAMNNKVVWTERGIKWVTDTVIELSRINVVTGTRLLNTFQHATKLRPELRAPVMAALERIVAEISEDSCPTLFGQARAYLD
jgi:aminopeptidase N